MDGAHDEFIGQNRKGIHADIRHADADGVRRLVTVRIAEDEALDRGRAGQQADMHRVQLDGDAGDFRSDGFHAGLYDAVKEHGHNDDRDDDENDQPDADAPNDFFHN